MYIAYIIENPSGRIYIGTTEDVERRSISHNHPQGPDWTQGKGPWRAIYTEQHETKSDALKRERYLKSLKAGQRIKKILHITDTVSCSSVAQR